MNHSYKTSFRFLAGIVFGVLPNNAQAGGCGIDPATITSSRPYAIAAASRHEMAVALHIAGADHYFAGLLNTIGEKPAAALTSFSQALDDAQSLRPAARAAKTSAIAYWSSRALNEEGRRDAADQALTAAAAESGTFYGELANSQKPTEKNYPRPQFLYIDGRTTNNLVWAVIWVECRFQTECVSSANALGWMQVIPSTAQDVTSSFGYNVNNDRMLNDPRYNVAVGSTYLGNLITHYNGYLPLTIAAYNAGPACADSWLQKIGDPRTDVDPLLWIESIPIDQTRDYVQAVLATYIIYASTPAGK